MNIFCGYEDIFGKAETTHLNRTLEEFCALSESIRRRLEHKAYLLDQYLTMLLEGAEATKLFTAAEKGLYAMNDLLQLCRLVMAGKDDPEEHPLFETVREYIHSHPLRCQEEATKQALYCVALAGCFVEHAAKEYWRTLKEAQRASYDIVELRDLYRKISVILNSEDDMERLILLFRQRFLMVPAMAGYLQGMTTIWRKHLLHVIRRRISSCFSFGWMGCKTKIRSHIGAKGPRRVSRRGPLIFLLYLTPANGVCRWGCVKDMSDFGG